MKKRIFFGLISTILLSSCSSDKRSSDIDSIIMDMPSNKISTNDIVSVIDTIFLKQSNNYNLQSISKIKVYKNKYYLLDSRGKAIYSFREDGTFLHQIGVRGRGRGEYLDIIDFTINPDNENIIILSNCSKINVYNNTGHFLLSKKLSESLLWSIEATNWGYVCSTRHKTYTSGEEAFLIYCFDKNFNLLSRNIPVLPFQVQTPTFFSEDIKTADSSVFVLDPFGLSIYKIEGPETIKKAYDIQIKNFISEECLRDGMLFIEKQREYNWIYDWLITEKQIVCSYVFDKNYCISNYKIKDNEQDNFLFDFENSDGILPNLFNSEEGIFLSSCIIDYNSYSLYGIIRWRTKQN